MIKGDFILFEHKPYHLEDELCFAIYTAQKSYTHFYSLALRDFGLTYPQYITLLVLWEEREPMIIRDLGKRLHLDTGTLTPLLKRMEKDGWLTRTRSLEDGRRVYIELTDKSLSIEKSVKRSIAELYKRLDMSDNEFQDDVRAMKTIVSKLQRMTHEVEEEEYL